MGDFLILERMTWFDQELKANHFPNASKLSERFEISTRTARRCIDFMRDRMQAPIEYDASRKGFFYTEDGFDLPHYHASQEEILSILIAGNLLSKAAGGLISRSIGKFSKKLFSEVREIGLDKDKMNTFFSSSWSGYAPAPIHTFRTTTQALLKNKQISFVYCSPACDKGSRRTACHCGKIVKAAIPKEHRSGYGARFSALIAEMSGIQGNSRETVRSFCKSVLNVSISAGAIQKVIDRASKALKPCYNAIGEKARENDINHFDETSWFKNGALHWLWVMANCRVAYFMIHKNRSKQAFLELIKDWQGVLVSDNYGTYKKWVHLKQGKLNGFSLTKDNSKQYKLQSSAYNWHSIKANGRNRSGFSSMDLVGVLEVTDVEKFNNALFKGIGRAKAFGCGLMLVRRT